MTLLEEQTFARTDIVPSWLFNALQKYLSVGAFQLRVEKYSDQEIYLPAGPGDGAMAVSIGGLWRWIENPTTPQYIPFGTPAQTIPVYAYTSNNNIASSPQPFTDLTDYSFSVIAITSPPGGTPPAPYRHIADITWDGTRIQRITQLVPPTRGDHSSRHVIGGKDPIYGMNHVGRELVGEASFWLPSTSLAAGIYLIAGDGSLFLADGSVLMPANKGWKHFWLDPADWLIKSGSGQPAIPWRLFMRATLAIGTPTGGAQLFPNLYSVQIGTTGGGVIPFGLSQILGNGYSGAAGFEAEDTFTYFGQRFVPGDVSAGIAPGVFAPGIQVGSATAAGTDIRGKITILREFDPNEPAAILP